MKLITVIVCIVSALASCPGLTSAQDGPADSLKAVFEYKTWDCTVKGNKATLIGKYRVTILNRRGKEYGVVTRRESRYVKLKHVRATMFDSNGEELLTRSKKEFDKWCGFDDVAIYTDQCLYSTEFESQRYPVSIEVEYKMELKSLFFWRGPVIQEEVPVMHSAYRLTIGGDTPFRYKMYGADVTPIISNDRKGLQYEWTIDSLPALDDVDYVPPGFNEPVRLEFCPELLSLRDYEFAGSQWSSIGEWYGKLCQKRMLKGADSVIESSTEPSRRIVDSLYSTVQKEIRYVAVSIGIGGWQPHKAKSTLEHKYGDCKDMSNVLVSQLHLNGITAYPVLLLTRGEGITDPDFPGFGFNHVITMAVVGQDTIWMDPTCDKCPFGTLPRGDQGIPVLVVTENGGKLCTTPVSEWTDNATLRTTRWDLQPSLHANLTTELSTTGEYARYLRNRLKGLDRDETRRFVDNQFRGAPKKYTIDNYEFENVSAIDEPFIIRITGRTRKPARRIGGVVYFNPFLVSGLNGIEQTDLSDRVYPLYMVYPETEQDVITVKWDSLAGIDSVFVPSADSVAYTGGHFTIQSHLNEDFISCKIEKACYLFTVDTSHFNEFVDYRKGVKRALSQHIKLFE